MFEILDRGRSFSAAFFTGPLCRLVRNSEKLLRTRRMAVGNIVVSDQGATFWIVQVRFSRPAFIFRTEALAKEFAKNFKESRIMKVKQVID
jgi:hypothetical protein